MKRLRTLRAIPALLATAMLFATIGPMPAQAQAVPQGAASVSISPPTTALDATPGDSKTTRVSLINGSNVARTFNVSVKNFTAAGESGQADLTDADNPYALEKWMKVTPTSVTLDAGKTQDFEVTIAVPAGTGPGGRYGAVVFTPVASNDPNANLSVVSEVSSLFLVRVAGTQNEKLSIDSFKSQSIPKSGDAAGGKDAGFFQKGPVNLAVRIKNDGNIHEKPTGTITLTNIFGSKIKTLKVTPQNVLPGTVRKLDVKWDKTTLFGFYKAKVDLTYGSTGEKLTATTSFWAAPLGPTAGGLVAIVAVFLLLWLPRKRLKKAFRALASGDSTDAPAESKPVPAAESPLAATTDPNIVDVETPEITANDPKTPPPDKGDHS